MCDLMCLPNGGVCMDYYDECRVTSGQSYKQFTLVIYDSRAVIWGIFKSDTTLDS